MNTQSLIELQKCLNGDYYNCHDPIFLEFKRNAEAILASYNEIPYDEPHRRRECLETLFSKIGQNVSIGHPFTCDYGRHIEIGNNVSINTNCIFVDCNKIIIGDNVLIAPGVQLNTASHPVELSERRNFNYSPDNGEYFWKTYARPIRIGSNVWIGANVTIIGGVTIGDGAVIGAGSVVIHDVPPNVLAAGNPCRVIRTINHPN